MKNLKNIILILIGFIWAFFIIWNRLFRVRLPRSIFEVSIIFVISLSCFIFIILLYYIYKYFFKEHKPNSFFTKFLKRINNAWIIKIIYFITQAPITTYTWLYQHIKIKYFIENTTYTIILYLKDLNNIKILLIIYVSIFIIPRSIIIACFIIDVFYHHYFYFFYKSLILLLIPLLGDFLLFIINDLSYKNKNFIELHLDFIEEENKTYTISLREKAYEGGLKDTSIVDLNYWIDLWQRYGIIISFCEFFQEYKIIYNIKFYIIYYILYLIGLLYWIYLLL